MYTGGGSPFPGAESGGGASPDEVAQLLQGAKGTVSPEYRTLLEDYYRALADTARQ